jgi:hypothetical protein
MQIQSGRTVPLRVFLLAIYSHLYSFALRFLFIQTHTTSFSTVQLLYTEAERRKIYRKPVPTSLWFKKSLQILKSENYTQKPQWNWNWIVVNSAFGLAGLYGCEFWSRIHECTILLRFLGIILLPNTQSMAQSGTHIAILCNFWDGTFAA